MDFLQLSQLLFDRELLASTVTVHDVLNKYKLATSHGSEYVGLVKKQSSETKYNTQVFKGTDGTKIGLLPIKGMLVYEETGWEALCGMTSYEGLQAKAEKMILQEGVESIILEINSGGGMAYGCFEAAMSVRALADKHNVKITSYVDGMAASGAYAWCCIADEVIVNPMGKVGSIGVVLPLTNYSEADKKEGIQRIYITAGKSKVPYDEDGKFTKEALDDIKESVMDTYDVFVNHVAEARGLSKEVVIDTEAKVFNVTKALEIGLIDEIMTKDQFYEHLGNFNGDRSMAIQTDKIKGADEDVKTEENSPLISNLTGQINTLTSEKQTLSDQVSTLTEELTREKQKVVDLQNQINVLNKEAEDRVASVRRDKLSALVSADKLEDEIEFTADFSDEKFDKYISKLADYNEKVEAEFEEKGQGNDGEEDELVGADESIALRIRKRQNRGS